MRRRPPSLLAATAGGLMVMAALVAASPGAAAAPPAPPPLRPVLGRVVASFRPPLTRYGPGHLGVDFAAPPGAAVRAVEAGTVVFAGPVGATRHVVVADARRRRVSYSYLASVRVRRGDRVRRGEAVGAAGGKGPHHDGGVVHIGLRIGDAYVDPMQLFAQPGAGGSGVHLVPVGVHESAVPSASRSSEPARLWPAGPDRRF
jgi:murein DD-endopeptidase MepM/ murein hydrolase activator NlpD